MVITIDQEISWDLILKYYHRCNTGTRITGKLAKTCIQNSLVTNFGETKEQFIHDSWIL